MKNGRRIIALDVKGASFFSEHRSRAFRGVIRYAQENRSWRLVVGDPDSPYPGLSLSHSFHNYSDLKAIGVEGIILAHKSDPFSSEIARAGLPAVSLFGFPPTSPFPTVRPDDFAIGQMAAGHFLKRGFRHFGFCRTVHWRTMWANHRYEGFLEAVQKAGRTCHRFDVDNRAGSADQEATMNRLEIWIREQPKPLALMACNDGAAMHAVEACHNLRLGVPDEVAILGVDNNPLVCETCIPNISSIDPDLERVGYEGAALLSRMLEDPGGARRDISVPPLGVMTRLSSDVLAVEDRAVAAALVFIRAHFSELISVNDIARASRLSQASLCRRFKESLGHSVGSEVRRLRLEKARNLLADSVLTLDEIAQRCGLRRATYLTNFFTKHVGESPGNWRRKHASRR